MYAQKFRHAAALVAFAFLLVEVGPATAAYTAPADEERLILAVRPNGGGGGGIILPPPAGGARGGGGGDGRPQAPAGRQPLKPPAPPVTAQEVVNAKKVSEIIKLLEKDGWQFARQKGSHRQFKHPHKSGTVTVAGKKSDTLSIGTRNSIARQAGLAEAPRDTPGKDFPVRPGKGGHE
jgi:predicted RNA binding protein YcfA (HicA-like mRNA interferase family)